MRVIVATVASGVLPWSVPFIEVNSAYCKRHGYSYVLHGTHRPERHASWEKLPLAISLLPQCDWLLMIDLDAHFVSDQPIDDIVQLAGDKNILIATNVAHERMRFYPPGHEADDVNCGVFLVRNCARSLAILKIWNDLSDAYPEWRFTWPVEQGAFVQHILPIYRNDIEVLLTDRHRRLNGWKGSYIRHYMGQCDADRTKHINKFLGRYQRQPKRRVSGLISRDEIAEILWAARRKWRS